MPGYTLSAKEWQVFTERYWQKQPAVLHKAALANADEIFQMLVQACERYRAKDADAPFLKLYVNGAQVVQNVQRHLPTAADQSPAGYEARLVRELGAENFTLFMAGFEAYSSALYERAQEFLGDLFEQVGLPAGHVELELFLGRYSYTPGGIHNEECTNFQWVIDGNKTMHTWPEDTWNLGELAVNTQHDSTSQAEEHFLDNIQIDDYRNQSIALQGQPGDILYWPSRYWHVGETPDLSMSITMAIYMNGQPYTVVNDVITSMWQQHAGASNSVLSYPLKGASASDQASEVLPDSVVQTTDILKQICNSAELQYSLMEQWLKRVSNLSFSKKPELLSARMFTNTDSVQRISKRPIIWSQPNADKLLYAVNGHCATTEAHLGIIRLLQCLNREELTHVEDLLSQFAAEFQLGLGEQKSKELFYSTLKFLYQTRAIAVITRA